MGNTEKYSAAFRIAQSDLGMTGNYIRQLGQEHLFWLMVETGREWDEEGQAWIELGAPRLINKSETERTDG